ncbi:hypothetical protein ACXZ1M_20490 [Duganella sp. PWIR1]
MRKITIGELADILEVMTIKHSIDSGFAIAHHGDIEGRPIIAISTWRGSGDCYILD